MIAIPVLFFFFIGLFTFAHVAAGKVIVQRAASAGVRAAVVFLPDDPEYYGSGGASKEDCVKRAVKLVLIASQHFKVGDSDFTVEWTPTAPKKYDPTTVTVTATFNCDRLLGHFVCGSDQSVQLTSRATLAYQEGPVEKQ